jgi:signal peptidase II
VPPPTGTLRISPPEAKSVAAIQNRGARLAAAMSISAALLVDIAMKRLLLAEKDDWNNKTIIPGFLDTHYAYNRGVSFSLFWQDTSFGSEALAALQMVFILTFAVLAFRAHKPIVAAGLGLIVGGALGNIADRLGMGAVFDFLVVRLGAIPFFVCNSADIFISLGVMVLGYDMLLVEIQRRRDAAAHPSTGSG